MELDTGAKLLGLVGTTYAGLRVGWRWARSVKTAAENRMQILTNVETALQLLAPKIDKIEKEMMANGGGSIHDVVMDIRNEMARERAARRVMTNVASFEMLVDGEGETEVIFVSPTWVQLTGLTRDDCAADGWVRCVVPEDRDRVAHLSRQAIEGETVFSTQYTVEHIHTRHRVQVNHTSTPIPNYRNRVVGWVGVLHPVVTWQTPGTH